MKAFSFEPNQLVYIRVATYEERDEVYPSRIEDIWEDSLALAAPMYKSGLIRLAPGREVWVELAREGSFYRFQTVVRENIDSPIPLLVVNKPEQIERCNRRRFFRFQTRLPISFRFAEYTYTGHTIDLSGNGFCAVFPGELPELDEEAELDFLLSLPDGYIESKGRVVREEREERKFTYLFVAFEELAEADQDQIVAYLFEEQRKIRKRERE